MGDESLIDAISSALNKGNTQGVVDMFRLMMQRNNALKSTLSEISNEIAAIKSTSDNMDLKLSTLCRGHHLDCAAINNTSDKPSFPSSSDDINDIIALNRSVNSSSSAVLSQIQQHTAPMRTRPLSVESEDTMTDLSRFFQEQSEVKSDKTESSITYDHGHEARASTSTFSQSSAERESIKEKLESSGRILALIEKSETKRVSKQRMTRYLRGKGVSQSAIDDAFSEWYSLQNLSEIEFGTRPLPFQMAPDEHGNNGIVCSVHKGCRIQNGWRIHEISGKRVDGRSYQKITDLLSVQECPFSVVFRAESNEESVKTADRGDLKPRPTPTPIPVHEHSFIPSVGTKGGSVSLEKEEKILSIDWEQIGQILLDFKFLPSARLINQVLCHCASLCINCRCPSQC